MIDVLRIVAAIGVVAGSLFGLLAAVGLVRFPDLYTRLHAASKAGAVGTGLILLALAIVSLDAAVILRSIIAILFVLLTTPISAHLLARTSYMTGVKPADLTKTNEMP
jgi:multicomponent Na+:H+ antiporter subunit G